MTDADFAAFISRSASVSEPLAVAAVYRGFPGLFITEVALSATKVPVLHIIGSLDTTRLSASRHLKDKVLPSAEFIIVEGATHTGPQALYRNPKFVETVERFITSR